MSEPLRLTPGESLTIRRSVPELLEVEALYAPHGSPPPKHLHPSQSERFEVLEGELRVRLAGEERALSEGAVLEVPSGAVHQIWNPSHETARVIWRTTPGGRTQRVQACRPAADPEACHRAARRGRSRARIPGRREVGRPACPPRVIFRARACRVSEPGIRRREQT